MTKLKQLYMLALVALVSVLLAPSAQAAEVRKEYVCTDNMWETERNPYALPTTMPHWLSDLCRHENYTNYQGYCIGWRSRTMFGTWFYGTNTLYCTSLPVGNKKTNPLYEENVRTANWTKGAVVKTRASDKTCLAQIERDTEAAIGNASDPDTLVGKRVSLALCKILRPHEYEGASGTATPPPGTSLPNCDFNGSFFSNIVYNVGIMLKPNNTNPLAGQSMNGRTSYHDEKRIEFDAYDTDTWGRPYRICKLTPTEMIEQLDKYYSPGLKDGIETLKLMPNNWSGTYLLHNRDYKKTYVDETFVWTNTVTGGPAENRPRRRPVTHPEAWPMFDEDIHLDRADVLLLRCACHALETVVSLTKAYQLPDGAVGQYPGEEIKQLMQWQENFHAIGFTRQDRVITGKSDKDVFNRVGYGERLERAFHDFFHLVPTFLKSVDDTAAMAEARASFVSALECFLDADAFITGDWPSKTGHTYGGQRKSEMLHLFEFAEPEEDDEDGGEWNIAGYREIIRKAYASLMGTGTDKAVQPLALAGEKGLAKAFDIKAGGERLDFSGLGADKDGTLRLNLNPFFDGSMTPRDFVTDVNACVTTNGPSHWVLTRYSQDEDRLIIHNTRIEQYPTYIKDPDAFLKRVAEVDWTVTNVLRHAMNLVGETRTVNHYAIPVAPSNIVNQLVLNVSKDTVSPTLCGLYPDGSLADDILTMTKRYPASGKGGPSGFARYVKVYDPRVVVTTSPKAEGEVQSPYALEEGKTYTAAPTKDYGGAFYVKGDATLTASNVTFVANESSKYGGAIYNTYGTVALTNATFTGNKTTDEKGGAIYNTYGTLSLDGVTFEGNEAKMKGGAIYNSGGTVHFDGAVTLVTKSDMIFNSNGTLNWNLTDGRAGLLNGYQNVTNYGAKAKMRLTIDDAFVAPTNVVIATGDFSDVTGKDTFVITNASSASAAATIAIGGTCRAGNTYFALAVKDEKLVLSALVPVKLSDVMLIDHETGKTNATAVVKVGDSTVEADENGVYAVLADYPLTVVYTAADDLMFGPGWSTKKVEIGSISGDTSLNDPKYAGLKPTPVARWADVREIAIDTRERIVVAAPEEVLPVAYHTNCWGAVKIEGGNPVVIVSLSANGKGLISELNKSGYYEWMPVTGAYGSYDIRQSWLVDGTLIGSTNKTVYYSGCFPLTWNEPEDGTFTATLAGETITNGTPVLGYSYVDLAATPDVHYELTGWTATTNGIPYAGAFTNATTLVTRFEMPNSETTVSATFAWQSEFNEKKTVAAGETWEVFADDYYYQSLENHGTIVWKPGATNKLGKVSGLTSYAQLQNGQDGKLQIVFDESLTNGTYWIAGSAAMALGEVFEITNGTDAKNCSVVDEDSLETAAWVYVGAKRFKLYVDGEGDLQLLVEWGIPQGVAIEASPAAAGTVSASTNGAMAVRAYPGETVSVEAVTNLHWQFSTWSGADADGNVLTFASATSSETTFKMPETNVTVTANFIVSEAYKLETATAISNAAANASSAINAKNLSQTEKDGYNAQIREERDAQVAAIGLAVVPADVAKALTDANKSFEATKKVAQACADRTWTIETVVAYTNIAGTVSVTNESQARLAVAIAATADVNWQFVDWTVVDAEGKALPVLDPTAPESSFTMPETNVTVTANFIVNEVYKDVMAAAVYGKYDAIEAELEKLRNHRLTDAECDTAIRDAAEARDDALQAIADAVVPHDVQAAFDEAVEWMDDALEVAEEVSAAKPHDLIIAKDFSATPPFENWDAETRTFTWDGQKYKVGVNAFYSFSEAFKDGENVPYVTDVHVFGMQTILDEPTMYDTWNLDLVTYEDERDDEEERAVLTVAKGDDGVLVNITNKLGRITGRGGFILGKTSDNVDPSIYADFIADGADITVINTGAEQTKDAAGNVIVTVDDRSKAVTDPESGAACIVLPGVVNAEGGISVNVEENASNRVVVAGSIETQRDIEIRNASTNALDFGGKVVARNVSIDNCGKISGAEGSITAGKILASGDVTIVNNAHLEADVEAEGNLHIYNGSARTIVGIYDGKTVSIEGGDAGAISNVFLVSDEDVTLSGVNVLTGQFGIKAGGAIRCSGVLAWDISGDNHTATFADWDAVTFSNAECEVRMDFDQALGRYVLAERAFWARKDGVSVRVIPAGTGKSYLVTMGKDPVIDEVCSRMYRLDIDSDNALVLTVFDRQVFFENTEYTVQEGGAVRVYVFGGLPDRAVQAMLTYAAGPGKCKAAYVNGKKYSFPIKLCWAKGNFGKKEILLQTEANDDTSKDLFFALQLSAPVGEEVNEANSVCIVKLEDASGKGQSYKYVRALAYPANAGTVSGSGKLTSKTTKRKLKAKSAGIGTFRGWYAAQDEDPTVPDLTKCLTTKTSYTAKAPGIYFAYYADVTPMPSVDLPDASAGYGVGYDAQGDRYSATVGVKLKLPCTCTGGTKLSVGSSSLPKGLKWSNGVISGVPEEEGTFKMKLAAKNAAGTHTAYYALDVAPLPKQAVGTWAGVLHDDANKPGIGSVKITVGSTGKISAKVMSQFAGTRSFSGKGYTDLGEDRYKVSLKGSSGEKLTARLDLTAGWGVTQMAGAYDTSASKSLSKYGENGEFSLQRNPYDAKTGTAAARQLLAEYVGTYEELIYRDGGKVGDVSFKVGESGKVLVSATVGSKTFSGTISGAIKVWSDGVGTIEASLRTGKSVWSVDASLNGAVRSTSGAARYLKKNGSDQLQTVGKSDLE